MIDNNQLRAVRKALLAINEASQPNVMRTAVGAGGLVIESEAKRRVPRVTSSLMRSIHTEVSSLPNTARAEVGTDLEYGPHVEFGTSAHVIRPKNARSLRFKIGGRIIYAKSVKHPGTRAQPFLVPAFEAKKDQAAQEVVDVLWIQVRRAA